MHHWDLWDPKHYSQSQQNNRVKYINKQDQFKYLPLSITDLLVT